MDRQLLSDRTVAWWTRRKCSKRRQSISLCTTRKPRKHRPVQPVRIHGTPRAPPGTIPCGTPGTIGITINRVDRRLSWQKIFVHSTLVTDDSREFSSTFEPSQLLQLPPNQLLRRNISFRITFCNVFRIFKLSSFYLVPPSVILCLVYLFLSSIFHRFSVFRFLIFREAWLGSPSFFLHVFALWTRDPLLCRSEKFSRLRE